LASGVLFSVIIVALVLNTYYRVHQVPADDMDAFAYLGFGLVGGLLGALGCPLGAAIGARIGAEQGNQRGGVVAGAVLGVALAVAIPWLFG
jgi:hypothetical protein